MADHGPLFVWQLLYRFEELFRGIEKFDVHGSTGKETKTHNQCP